MEDIVDLYTSLMKSPPCAKLLKGEFSKVLSKYKNGYIYYNEHDLIKINNKFYRREQDPNQPYLRLIDELDVLLISIEIFLKKIFNYNTKILNFQLFEEEIEDWDVITCDREDYSKVKVMIEGNKIYFASIISGKFIDIFDDLRKWKILNKKSEMMKMINDMKIKTIHNRIKIRKNNRPKTKKNKFIFTKWRNIK